MPEQSEHRIVLALLNSSAWPVLESAAIGSELGFSWERDDTAEWNHLVKVGIAEEPGKLFPAWAEIVRRSSDAPTGFRFASQVGQAVFDADIAVSPDLISILLRRFVVDESGKRVQAAKELELTSGPPGDAWAMLRRVLPPLEEFRADPEYASPDKVRRVDVPESALPELAQLATDQDPGEAINTLPPNLRDFLAPKAVTTMLFWRKLETGYEYALRYWVKGERGFYTLRAAERGPVIEEVPAGDLGYQFVWYLTGAMREVAS